DVGNDAPAVARRNLGSVVGHGAESVGHDVQKISQWRFAQALGVEGRRRTESALDNHAVAIAGARVTRSAINVEAFASACKYVRVNREGHEVAGVRAEFSSVEVCVIAQFA